MCVWCLCVSVFASMYVGTRACVHMRMTEAGLGVPPLSLSIYPFETESLPEPGRLHFLS